MALENVIEKLSHGSQTAAQNLRVKSALNPMLWLCGIITPVCLVAAYFFASPIIQGILVACGVLPVLVTCFLGCYFAFCTPEKLQSEDYQIKREVLQVFQVRATSTDLSPSSLEAIARRMIGEPENQETSKT